MISEVRYIYRMSDIYIGGQIYISDVRYDIGGQIYIYISEVRYIYRMSDMISEVRYISDLKISGETY